MASGSALARTPLFAGLTAGELDVVAARMRPRRFASGERLCSAGDPVEQVWVITGGLVHWLAPTADGEGELVARMRKGDVIGAQDVITGEERLASVIASIPTSALEIDSADLLDLARQFPEILINIVRVQRERLFRANARSAEKERGEEIALVTGPSLSAAVGRIVAAARTASARPLTFLDRRLSFAGALTAADDLVSEHATVLIPGELDPETLAPLLEEVDRVVALAGSAAEAERLGRISPAAQLARLEVVLVGEPALAASRAWPVALRVVRTCARETAFPLADADLGWLARHITRTKLGLALGAGGVKGYAHVGALQVIEEAGYTVDVVGGSSIGGFVATHVALGYDSAEINARFRAAFNPETVAALFASPFGGGGKSADVLSELLQKATAMKSFDDVVIPLAIMAVDLTDRLPRPLREGPLWEALAATLAVAGVFPPRERDGHRLVDGLHLVPVPTGSVLEDGADIVVSVNLMGAETLDRWPTLPDLETSAAPARKGRYNALDTMLEVMDLSQVDTSERHANIADVVITPRFGPADWRDFHLGDLFLAAGRAAALEQLPALQAISRPVDLTAPADGFSRSDSLIV